MFKFVYVSNNDIFEVYFKIFFTLVFNIVESTKTYLRRAAKLCKSLSEIINHEKKPLNFYF